MLNELLTDTWEDITGNLQNITWVMLIVKYIYSCIDFSDLEMEKRGTIRFVSILPQPKSAQDEVGQIRYEGPKTASCVSPKWVKSNGPKSK